MELLYFALPVSLVVAGGFLAAFLWAARDDQFEDLDSPARRMLHDDAPLPPDVPRPHRDRPRPERRARDGRPSRHGE